MSAQQTDRTAMRTKHRRGNQEAAAGGGATPTLAIHGMKERLLAAARESWDVEMDFVNHIYYQLRFRSQTDYLSTNPVHLVTVLKDRPKNLGIDTLGLYLTTGEAAEFVRRQKLGDRIPLIRAAHSSLNPTAPADRPWWGRRPRGRRRQSGAGRGCSSGATEHASYHSQPYSVPNALWMPTKPPPARMYWRSAVLAESRCAPVVVLTAEVGATAVPCFHIVSRLVLRETTALYGLPMPGIRVTSSVQSTWTPTSPIHLIIAFCATCRGVRAGLMPAGRAGPRCA